MLDQWLGLINKAPNMHHCQDDPGQDDQIEHKAKLPRVESRDKGHGDYGQDHYRIRIALFLRLGLLKQIGMQVNVFQGLQNKIFKAIISPILFTFLCQPFSKLLLE